MKSNTQFSIPTKFLEALKQRREKFLHRLGENGLAIVSNHIVPPAFERYGFRSSSSFYYLTGLAEPDAIAVFCPSHAQKSMLFVRERDASTELWNGPMAGIEGARDVLQFDGAYPLSEFNTIVAKLLQKVDPIYWDPSPHLFMNANIRELVEGSRTRRQGAWWHTDVETLIGELRLFKDDWECEQIQRANDIASRAHQAAMGAAKPGARENEIQAVLEGAMMALGAGQLGYTSIVGAGENACCLHYTLNASRLEENDLLLIDAGCESNYYTADITRTFPVSGKFSARQKDVYELVLATQKKIIEMVRPGIFFQSLNEKCIELLTDGLVQLKLISGARDEIIRNEGYKAFYPHGVSHWLGLDVHDVGRYKLEGNNRKIEAGMCFTVEPGIYIQPHNEGVSAEWRGIGVRIEDNILVTEKGYHNFTSCVKDVTDVEAMVRG